MSEERIRKWIKALRSGKYRKTKATLVSTNGEYCGVGVYMDVRNREEHGTPFTYLAYVNAMPSDGLFGYFREIPFEDRTKVMSMNDLGGEYCPNGHEEYSFDDIADYLESKYLPEEHGPVGKREEAKCLLTS